jgi:putative FmdB family regulatory protein
MPIYEYACNQCEHVFDVLQKINDDPLKYCPECGAPELRKLLSAPHFRLKGGGWYETDFKTGGKRNLAEGSEKKADGDAKEAGKEAGKEVGKEAGKDAGKQAGKDNKAGGDKPAAPAKGKGATGGKSADSGG